MGLVLDTCVFIRAEKQGIVRCFDEWQSTDEEDYISVVTASELLMGVCRANTEARRLKRSAFVETIINEIPIIDFTLEVARLHAEVYAYLAEQGQLIGAHDLMIAATALANGYGLLTSNYQEFSRVPGLNVIEL